MHKHLKVKFIIPKTKPRELNYGYVETLQYGQLCLAYYLEKNLYICFAHFEQNKDEVIKNLENLWPDSELTENEKLTQQVWDKYIMQPEINLEVYVVLNGTGFQMKVWKALLDIPYGEERTYSDLAVAIGNPKAVRAVASAIGSNNIAIFIPCHRVRAKTGDVHKFRWGSDLKKKLLFNEFNNK